MRVSGAFATEQGAVTVLVALSMIALCGMVVLVVDVGGLLSMRRRMVTAADSAALAAAQSCADPFEAPEALLQADGLAEQNVTGVRRSDFQAPLCGSSEGEVGVAYESDQELYFGPILGSDDTAVVAAKATAIWGPAGTADPVPIALSKAALQSCGVPNAPAGTECAFWYERRDLGNSEWAMVNLDSWGSSQSYRCPSRRSRKLDWLRGGYGEPLVLEYPDPTYMCIDTRTTGSEWSALRDRAGETVFFLVHDETTQVDRGGAVAPPPLSPSKYNAIGFAPFEIVQVLDGDEPEAVGELGEETECEGTADFTYLSVVSLDTAGCYTPPVSITNLRLSKGSDDEDDDDDDDELVVYEPDIDYSFDSSTREVTWLRTDPENGVRIEFDVSTSGSPGECGIRRPSGSAKCLVVLWNGVQTGGMAPSGGEGFGLAAVRLVE